MTISNMNIPAGWQIKKLAECVSIFGGYAYSSQDCTSMGIKWLKISNVGKGKLEKSEFDYLPIEYKYSTKNYLLKKGDIVMALTRPITDNKLKITYIDDDEYLLNQRVGKLLFSDNSLPNFMYAKLTSPEIVWYISSLLIGTDPPNLTGDVLNQINILLPPLPEQEKIAEILSCWDEAIEKVSDLIEQKKLLKKGLMQKLLTGKTRLSGFTQPWKEVKLGEICNIKKGQQLNKLDMEKNADYPVLNGGVDFSGYTTEYNTKANTITISEGGNSCGFVNFIKQDFWAGGHCYVIDNIQISKEFLFQSLKLKEVQIMCLRVGSGLPNIQLPSLKKYKITIPSDIAEQKAIADILSTADDEIEKLKTKLDLLKLQKKGLMQQLLTGKIRVKVDK